MNPASSNGTDSPATFNHGVLFFLHFPLPRSASSDRVPEIEKCLCIGNEFGRLKAFIVDLLEPSKLETGGLEMLRGA
jgi:hypothetical protein